MEVSYRATAAESAAAAQRRSNGPSKPSVQAAHWALQQMALKCRAALLALPALLLSMLPAKAMRVSPGGGGSGLVSGRGGSVEAEAGRGGSGGSNGDEDGSRLFFQPDGTFRILQITDLQ
jgi:hypothetical protein